MSDSAAAAVRKPNVIDWTGLIAATMPFVIALIFGAVLLAATGRDPIEVYGLMLDEGFGGPDEFAATLSAATPILFCAIATAISFRAGLFNMGIEGAFYLGGLAGTVVGFMATGLPGPVLILAELGVGAVVGGVWLLLPGWLKARLDVDEVVSTLMLNFVAINFTAFLVNHVFLAPGAGNSQTPLIAEADGCHA